jgi:hypothetical protein
MPSKIQEPTTQQEKTRAGLFGLPALLALGLIAIAVVIAVYVFVFGQSDTPIAYDADDVVYDQPLHGSYILDSVRTTVAFPDLDDPLPLILIPSTFHDMGRVRPHGVLTHIFVIENAGVAPLTIVQLYTTGDYVTADLSSSVIPPGKVALLTVTLDTVRAYELGQRRVRRGAVLTTNDPHQQESAVWVQALIVP